MGWKFSRGGKPEMIDATPREQDAIHHNFIARRILISEYHKSLRHRMSPKDPNKSQIIHMKDIQDRFIGILNQSNLRLKEHEVLYRNIYTPTIQYVLQGSCMSALELEQASRKSKSLFLQKWHTQRLWQVKWNMVVQSWGD
jgi:hypothetical protein